MIGGGGDKERERNRLKYSNTDYEYVANKLCMLRALPTPRQMSADGSLEKRAGRTRKTTVDRLRVFITRPIDA